MLAISQSESTLVEELFLLASDNNLIICMFIRNLLNAF